jgi:hypothetical protein
MEAALDVLGGKNRATCSYPPDEGQAEGFDETDAPGTAFFQRDDTLAGESAQMGFGSVGGFEAKRSTDFRPRGGATFVLDGIADELKDFLLTGGELF